MKTNKNLFFMSLTMLLTFSACKSNEGALTDTSCANCEDAMILFYGDPALDGCGWVVDVSSSIYMPSNLPPEFYLDSLKVTIKFKELGRVNCGLVKDAHPAMFIEEIRKRE